MLQRRPTLGATKSEDFCFQTVNPAEPVLKWNIRHPSHLHRLHWHYFFIFPLDGIYANFI
uniref:Uncharacterized protein n=1 Tax=Arundo donax TaxID=35708 RepID=A0A0A9DTI6_ARUDO